MLTPRKKKSNRECIFSWGCLSASCFTICHYWKGTAGETSGGSLGGKGQEMGGKVNQAASKLGRGPEEGRDYHHTAQDSLGRRRRAGKAAQVTAASRPVTQVMVTNGSRRGSMGSVVAGETEAPGSPVPPLCASGDAPEPVLTGFFPARRVTAAVTAATRRPAVSSPPAARAPPPPPLTAHVPAATRRHRSGNVHPPGPAARWI